MMGSMTLVQAARSHGMLEVQKLAVCCGSVNPTAFNDATWASTRNDWT